MLDDLWLHFQNSEKKYLKSLLKMPSTRSPKNLKAIIRLSLSLSLSLSHHWSSASSSGLAWLLYGQLSCSDPFFAESMVADHCHWVYNHSDGVANLAILNYWEANPNCWVITWSWGGPSWHSIRSVCVNEKN